MGLQLGNDLLELGPGLPRLSRRTHTTDYCERAQSISGNFAIVWLVRAEENVGRLYLAVRLWHEREGSVLVCILLTTANMNRPSHRNFDSRDGRPDNLTTPQQIKELRYPNVRSLPCWAGIVTSLVGNFVEDQIQATAASSGITFWVAWVIAGHDVLRGWVTAASDS